MPRTPRAAAVSRLWVDSSDWPRRLVQPTLTADDLSHILIDALMVRIPDHDVQATVESATVTTPEGNVLQARLASIFSTLRRVEPNDRLPHFESFLRALLEAVKNVGAGVRPVRRDSLVPLIRDDRYFGDSSPAAADACVAPFVGGLMVVYAWSGVSAFDVVTEDERKTLRLGPARLRALALRNLRRTLPPVERRRFGPLWAVATGGQLEPSLLLLNEVCTRFANDVTGDLIACVPTHQTFLYTGTGVSGGPEHLRRMAVRLAGPESSAAARTVLRFTGDSWVEHLGDGRLN